jgi:hypothetical protein
MYIIFRKSIHATKVVNFGELLGLEIPFCGFVEDWSVLEIDLLCHWACRESKAFLDVKL